MAHMLIERAKDAAALLQQSSQVAGSGSRMARFVDGGRAAVSEGNISTGVDLGSLADWVLLIVTAVSVCLIYMQIRMGHAMTLSENRRFRRIRTFELMLERRERLAEAWAQLGGVVGLLRRNDASPGNGALEALILLARSDYLDPRTIWPNPHNGDASGMAIHNGSEPTNPVLVTEARQRVQNKLAYLEFVSAAVNNGMMDAEVFDLLFGRALVLRRQRLMLYIRWRRLKDYRAYDQLNLCAKGMLDMHWAGYRIGPRGMRAARRRSGDDLRELGAEFLIHNDGRLDDFSRAVLRSRPGGRLRFIRDTLRPTRATHFWFPGTSSLRDQLGSLPLAPLRLEMARAARIAQVRIERVDARLMGDVFSDDECLRLGLQDAGLATPASALAYMQRDEWIAGENLMAYPLFSVERVHDALIRAQPDLRRAERGTELSDTKWPATVSDIESLMCNNGLRALLDADRSSLRQQVLTDLYSGVDNAYSEASKRSWRWYAVDDAQGVVGHVQVDWRSAPNVHRHFPPSGARAVSGGGNSGAGEKAPRAKPKKKKNQAAASKSRRKPLRQVIKGTAESSPSLGSGRPSDSLERILDPARRRLLVRVGDLISEVSSAGSKDGESSSEAQESAAVILRDLGFLEHGPGGRGLAWAPAFWLGRLYVSPGSRASGVAFQLLWNAIRFVEELPAAEFGWEGGGELRTLWMEVDSRNGRSMSLLAGLGAIAINRRESVGVEGGEFVAFALPLRYRPRGVGGVGRFK